MCDSTGSYTRGNDHPSSAREHAPTVPDFELIRAIGRGGFGQVWLASNRTTGHLRAVKVIPLRGSGRRDPAGREITSLTRLQANLRRQHDNLLTIHHVGQTGDHLFYVMDLADDVTGRRASADADYVPATLERRLRDGPLAPGSCLRCARQLLAGLASLHQVGMVHRDVKPANCLLVAGELKLADFGLLTEASPQVSQVGTRKYMPPDGRMDMRADVYAAGLVLYEMVTGLPADSFPRLGERGREIAADPTLCLLMRLALHACQPDPHHRHADAKAMLDEVAAFDAEVPIRPRSRHRRIVITVMGVVAILAVAMLGIWLTRPRRVHVNFITHPFEATVYLDGVVQTTPDGAPLRTPCTVEDLPARTHHVVFRHDRRPELNAGKFDFSKVQQIEVEWAQPP